MIEIKKEGVFLNENLELPFDKNIYVNEIKQKFEEEGFKTINGESILGQGNITINSNLLQTIVLKTPPKRYYFNSRNEIKLPGLYTQFKPKSDNSTIIVMATLAITKPYVSSFALKYGGQWIDSQTSNNPYHGNSFITHYMGGDSQGYLQTFSLNWAFKNKSIESKELALYYKHQWSNSSRGFYFNDRNGNDMRSRSIMIIMEVAND